MGLLQSSAFIDYSNLPKTASIAFLTLILILVNRKSDLEIDSTEKLHQKPSTYIILFNVILLLGCGYSHNPFDAIYRVIPFLTVSVLFLQFKKSFNENNFYYIIGVSISTLVILLSVYTLFTILKLDEYSHQDSYLFRYSFGHRNMLSNFLLLSIPSLLISYNNCQQNTKFKYLIIGAIIFSVTTISFLMTRSSYLGLVVFASIVLFGSFYKFLVKKGIKHLKTIIATLVLLGISAPTVLYLKNERVKQKVSELLNTSYGSGHERIELWKNTISLAQKNPIIGVGTNDWKIDILQYPIDTPQAISGTVYYQRAHNDFLQIFTENGLTGLLCYSAIFFLVIKRAISSDSISYFNKLFIIGGIFTFFTISFLSFPIERIELLFLLFVIAYPALPNTKTNNTVNISYAALFTLITLFLVVRGYNDNLLLNAKTNEVNSNTNDAHEYYTKINDSFYSIDHTSTPISWHKGNFSFLNNDFNTAVELYSNAVNKNPYHPHVLNNLASSHFQLGNHDEALKYFKKCIKYNPRFNEGIINYSAFLFNQNKTSSALIEITKMQVDGQHPNYNAFYLAIVKKYVLEAYGISDYYNDNEYLDLSLHCRYNNISVIEELENRINAINSIH